MGYAVCRRKMSHDLIIVGAGTAGCVLAERLTSSGKLRVLLLEAGGPPTNRFVSIPAGMPKLFKSECDWAFESEPQAAVGGRRVFTRRGKMLGGSSKFLEPPREHGFTLAPAVAAPRSRGRLGLRSPDPLAPPVIDPGFPRPRRPLDRRRVRHAVGAARTPERRGRDDRGARFAVDRERALTESWRRLRIRSRATRSALANRGALDP